MKTSAYSGFYKLSVEERLNEVAEFAGLTEEEKKIMLTGSALSLEAGDRMIENVIGQMPLPFGVAINFLINGKDYVIPMAVEEPSIVAAASNMARLCRDNGGFHTSNTGAMMIAQIQAVNVQDVYAARLKILENREKLMEIANSKDPFLVSMGGGMKDVDVRILGKKARMYLAMLKGETMDLDAVRLEMIAKILELRGALGK